MKGTGYFYCLFVLVTATWFTQQSDFPKLTGPYLGQKPPGMTPEVFAPGIVSTPEFREYSIFDFKDRLYASFRTATGAWGTPIDLSQRLNLPEGEMLPTLSPDRRYLFFCNRWDIYWVSAKIIDELRPTEARKGASR